MPQSNQQVELISGYTRRDGFERCWNEYFEYLKLDVFDLQDISLHLLLKKLLYDQENSGKKLVLSLRTIAAEANISVNRLQGILQALAKVELIEREIKIINKQKISSFKLHDPPPGGFEKIKRKLDKEKNKLQQTKFPVPSQSEQGVYPKRIQGGVSETDTGGCIRNEHKGVFETDTGLCSKQTHPSTITPSESTFAAPYRHDTDIYRHDIAAAASKNGAAAAAFNHGFHGDLKAKLLSLGLGEQNTERLLVSASNETEITRLQQAVELMELRKTERPIAKTQSYFRKLLASQTLAADLEQARLDHQTLTISEPIQTESREEEHRKLEYEFKTRIEAAFDALPVAQQEALKTKFLTIEGSLAAPGWKNWTAEAQAEWIRHQTIKSFWSEFCSDCLDVVGST